MPFVQPTGVAAAHPNSVAPVINSFNDHIKSSGSGSTGYSSHRKKNTEMSCRVVNSWVKSSTNLFSACTKNQPSAPKHKGGNNNGHESTRQKTPADHDGAIWIFTKTWHPVGVTVQSVIVFVHDVVEHCERYQPMFSAFAGKGIEVQSFDLPGFGETGVRADAQGITGGYDALLKEIDSAIDRACASHPQKPIFLMGHGMGGALALNYVCGLGLRITSLAGLISSSPYLKPTLAGAGSRFPGTYNRLGKWYSHLSIRFPVIPEELTRNREEQERHREDGMILDSVSLQCLGDMIYQGQKVLNKRWRHFPAQLPTLLLHGTADPICAFVATQQLSQQIIQKLKPASFVFKSWKGGMHDPHWDLDAQSVRSEYVHWIRSSYRHYVKAPLEPEMVASIMIKSARIRSRQSSIAAAQREKDEGRQKKKLAEEQERAYVREGKGRSTPMDGKEIAVATASTSSENFGIQHKDVVENGAESMVPMAASASGSGDVNGKKTKDKKKIKAKKPKKLSKAEKKQLELDQKNAFQNQVQEQPPATMDTGNAVINTVPGKETPQVLAPVPESAQTDGLSVQTLSLPSQATDLHSALLTAASMNAHPKILSQKNTSDHDQLSTLPGTEDGTNETETPSPAATPVAIDLNTEPEVDSSSAETSLTPQESHPSNQAEPEVDSSSAETSLPPQESHPSNLLATSEVVDQDTTVVPPAATEPEVTVTEVVNVLETEPEIDIVAEEEDAIAVPPTDEQANEPQDNSFPEHSPKVVQEPSLNTEVDISYEPPVPEMLASLPSTETVGEADTPIIVDVVA